MADPNIFERLGMGGNRGSNDPFAFLENVMTPDGVRSFQRQRQERQRLASQSMGTNERAGFNLGRSIGAVVENLRPRSHLNKMRAEAKSNIDVLDKTADEIAGMEFEGPLSGMERNHARLQALAKNFAEAGNQEAALQATIAADQLEQDLESERMRQSQAQLNMRQMDLNTQISKMRLDEERGRLTTERMLWPVETDEEGNPRLGEAMHRTDDAERIDARQREGQLMLTHADAMQFFGRQTANRAGAAVFGAADFRTQREGINLATSLYERGANLLELLEQAPANPRVFAAQAGSFVADIVENFNVFGDINDLIAHQRIHGDWETYETQRDLALAQVAEGRSLVNAQVDQLAFVFARLWNKSRPSDNDVRMAARILGGDAADRGAVIRAVTQLISQQVGSEVESFEAFLEEGEGDERTERFGRVQRPRVQRARTRWEETAERVRTRFPAPSERVATDSISIQNADANDGMFAPGP